MLRMTNLARAAVLATLALLMPSAVFAQDGPRSPETSPPACSSVKGLRAVLEARPTRFVILGEPHGTAEAPEFFADVVCNIGLNRPVLVALEIEDEMQLALNDYLAGDGGDEARQALLSERFWVPKYPDGRSSVAIVDLIERLRVLKRSGQKLQIVAFRNWDTADLGQGHMEIDSAAALGRAAAQAQDHLVLVLTGSFHARRAPPPDIAFLPMAGVLPREDVLTLSFNGSGGEQWACRSTCGSHSLTAAPDDRPRGVWLERVADGDFDGSYSIGIPATMSPPAIGPATRVTPQMPTQD